MVYIVYLVCIVYLVVLSLSCHSSRSQYLIYNLNAFSNAYINSSSHHRIITSSHHRIITSSHHRIITSSHCSIITSTHCRIIYLLPGVKFCICFIIFFIWSNCLIKAFTFSMLLPLPLAMRILRFISSKSGLALSFGVMD